MAYFSNGTEGMGYQEIYCMKCRQYKERPGYMNGEGCPVWDLHLLLDQYQACNAEPNSEGTGLEVTAFVLDLLIPRGELHNEQCRLFDPETRDDKTMPLFDDADDGEGE